MDLNILERMLQIRSKEEMKVLLDIIDLEKKKLIQSKDNNDLIRLTLLNFVLIYNPLSPKWKDKIIKEFTMNLGTFYDKKNNLSESILKLIDESFKEPSCYRILTNFEQKSEEKAHLECCFKLILLTKNLEYLLIGIKEYLLIGEN